MTTRSPASEPAAGDLLPREGSRPEPAGPAQVRNMRKKSVGPFRSRLWVVLIGGGVISACLAAIVGFFGQVSGRELAPSHFATRSFSYVEIPLLRLQITPIRRTVQYSPLAVYLKNAALVTHPQGQPTQWHLIELNRVANSILPADAKLLSDYLEQPGTRDGRGSNLYWHQWSIDQPELAAILWPAIQKLAQRELFLLVPGLFRIADLADSAESMQHDVQAYLVSHYEQLSRDLAAAGQAERAESLRREAISLEEES